MARTGRAWKVGEAGVEGPVSGTAEVADPGSGEALVKVKAAALNHRDVWICKGKYADIRIGTVLGSDGAGVVESVGAGVDAAWVGRAVVVNPSLGWGANPEAPGPGWRILGMPDAGTFCDYLRVSAENLVAKPVHLSFEEAATLPLAGLTAWRALFTRGRLKAGETLLVTGVGGGVAQFLLQFGLAAGARVYATSGSAEKLALARQAGASGGANYKESDWEKALVKASGPFDLVVDSAGGTGFSKLLDVTRPGGRVVCFGATAGNPPEVSQRKVFWKQLDILGTTMGSPADFAGMMALVESKALKPAVDTVYPFEEGAAAFQRMDAGEQYGKIVLSMG